MTVLASMVSAAARGLPATRCGRLLVLIYHRVHRMPDPMFPGEADAARFDEQMRLLRRHCVPLSLLEAVDRLRTGTLPSRAVCVTFDDGYADNEEVALPILLRHGVPATFFVAPGFLDGGRMWNDTVIESIRRLPPGVVDFGGIGLGCVEVTADMEARGAVAGQLLGRIKHEPTERRAALVEAIARHAGVQLPGDLMMTAQQVRKLAAAGMEIGAHTMTHPILRTLDERSSEREISDSRAALQAIIGRPVTVFAYPNGKPGDDYTSRDRDTVERLGFRAAFSTKWGAASRASDPFQLPRFTPWDRSPDRWLARMLLAYRMPA